MLCHTSVDGSTRAAGNPRGPGSGIRVRKCASAQEDRKKGNKERVGKWIRVRSQGMRIGAGNLERKIGNTLTQEDRKKGNKERDGVNPIYQTVGARQIPVASIAILAASVAS